MAVDNRAAGRLVSMLLGPMSGGAIQQKRSFLDGKLGQKVGSDLLVLTDEPHVKRGLGSRLFDGEGITARPLPLFESGAILVYLADKTGQLMPADPARRYETLQWLMFQMGGIGPMFGQNYHFQKAAPEKLPYAIRRYVDETRRLFGVMDKRLVEVPYLAGEYSLADVAAFPWVTGDWHGVSRTEFPHLSRWHDAIAARPAVQRGMTVPN